MKLDVVGGGGVVVTVGEGEVVVVDGVFST